MKKIIETKVNEMAQKVVPEGMLESFLNLDLEAKLTGLATFAHMSNDENVRDMCLQAIEEIKKYKD